MSDFLVTTQDGTKLFMTVCEPEAHTSPLTTLADAQALPQTCNVLILHGTCEYYARYDKITAELARKGFRVYRYDHRGHGKSSGKRIWVESAQDFAYDLSEIIERVCKEHPGEPLFVVAHSMGSTVALLYLELCYESQLHVPSELAGIVLSGCPTDPDYLMTGIDRRDVDEEGYVDSPLDGGVCKDPYAPYSYCHDPYIEHRISLKFLDEMNTAIAQADKALSHLNIPVLFLQGAEDQTVDPKSAQIGYDLVTDAPKELFVCDGVGHDVLRAKHLDLVLEKLQAFFKCALTCWKHGSC